MGVTTGVCDIHQRRVGRGRGRWKGIREDAPQSRQLQQDTLCSVMLCIYREQVEDEIRVEQEG